MHPEQLQVNNQSSPIQLRGNHHEVTPAVQNAPLAIWLLLIEDSDDDAWLVIHHLQKAGLSIEYDRVQTREELDAALSRREWDVIVADWRLPRFSAPAALQLLQSRGLDIPFVIVSGTITEESAAETMRAGAKDYVTKGKLDRLVPIIEREMADALERRERQLAEIELKKLEAITKLTTQCAPVGIVHTSVQTGRWLAVNAAMAEMLGYGEEELVGRSFKEFTHPDDLGANGELISRLAMGDLGESRFEKRYVRKDKSIVWARVHVIRVDQPDVEPFLLATAENITGEVAAEQERTELLAREQQARVTAEGSAETIGRLHTLTARLSTALTSVDVAKVAVEEGVRILGARSAVMFASSSRGSRPSVLGASGPIRRQRKNLTTFGQAHAMPIAHVMRTGEAVWLTSEEEAESSFPGFSAHFDPRIEGSLVVLSLEGNGVTFGAEAFVFDGARKFDDDIAFLARAITKQSAEALERARLYEQANVERAAAEKARSALQLVMEQAPCGMLALDSAGHVTHANGRTRTMLGPQFNRNPLDTQLRRINARFSGGGPLMYDQLPMAKALRGISAPSIELTYMSPDTGRQAWARSSAAPLVDNGDVVGAVATFEDITDRHRMMESLKESEERYRSLVENSPDANILLSKGDIVFANTRAVALLGGKSPNDLIGVDAISIVNPVNWKEAAERLLCPAGEGETLTLGDGTFVRIDGTPVDGEFEVVETGMSFRGERATQVIIHDVTERKRFERKLQESEERYRTLVETSPDGISVLAIDGTILMCNRVAAEQRGCASPEALIGHSAFEFGSHHGSDFRRDHFKRVLTGEDMGTLEVAYDQPHGPQRPVEILATLLVDEHGRPDAVLSISRDIGERKHLEGQLRHEATHDRMTGLANRDFLWATLD
jgi:PAS domain S-box-containing protein